MKKILAAMILAASVFSLAGTVSADTYVNGYRRQDGSYVGGHWRSDADGIKQNNWSYHGNRNPHTGEWGTRY